MATANISILKKTHQEVVCKVYGATGDNVTIDLTSANILVGATPVGSTGTITVAAGTTNVSGTYLSGLVAGNSILFTTTGKYIGVVSSVTSATAATLKQAAATGATSAVFLVDSSAGEEPSGTQSVAIAGVTWTGDNAVTIEVSRNSNRILTLPATGSSTIDFSGQMLPLETTNSTDPITVNINGSSGKGECWLKLRKYAGYANRIENATLGVYDDPSKVG